MAKYIENFRIKSSDYQSNFKDKKSFFFLDFSVILKPLPILLLEYYESLSELHIHFFVAIYYCTR